MLYQVGYRQLLYQHGSDLQSYHGSMHIQELVSRVLLMVPLLLVHNPLVNSR